MKLEERILNLLQVRPGLRAGEIANALRVERHQVDAAISGALKGKVSRVDRYRWTLADEAPSLRHEGKDLGGKETALARLCQYYLDCLVADGLDGVSVFASSRYDPEYVELGSHPLVSQGGLASMFEETGVCDLLETLRQRMRRKEDTWDLFLGYPTLVYRMRSRKGWEGDMVSPLFLHQLERGDDRAHAAYTLPDETPHLNLRAFERLLGADGRSIIEQVAALQDELGIGYDSEFLPEVDELVALLREIRPGWQWREPVDAFNLGKETNLSAVERPGVYNRAVLVMARRSAYTRGLELELRELQRIPKSKYAGTALGTWLDGKGMESSSEADDSELVEGARDRGEAALADTAPLIEIFPLNSEQRQTVRQGLSNDLTVVTGPPGTGKSQVVSSMLINAAWKGKRVLFASKNNKAVHVVETRANSVGPCPVLFRTGARELRETLAGHLTRLLSVTAGEGERSAYEAALEAHEAIAGRLSKLAEQEREIIELRNRVDALEQAAESARRAAGEASLWEWGAWPIDEFEKQLDDLKVAVSASDYSRQGFLTKLLWAWIKEGRRKRLEGAAQRCLPAFEAARVAWPERASNSEPAEAWAEPVAKLETCLGMAKSAKDYLESLTLLEGAGSLEETAAEHSRLTEDLRMNSSALWESWLSLMPDRLSSNDRRTLGQYVTALEMAITADAAGQPYNRDVGRLLRGSANDVVNILPCWAVTSLSARGRIPFEPGFFDLLIVDEASQCDIASVLPLLYRAKRAMVIGDPHQLKHISTLRKKQDEQLLARNDIGDIGIDWSYSANSLYDLATHVCRSEDIVLLKDHHRSHAQIIGFSNQRFYGGDLRVATRYENLWRPDPKGPAIRWIDVRGQVRRPGGSAINEEECYAVVTELRRLTLEQGYQGTIGVVSPFRAQVDRIRDLISQDERLSLELDRDAREFLAGTAHGFQGDEKDVIIFSPVVSSGMHDGARLFLSKSYNLFNVAITRARAALVVVGDRVAVAESGIQHLEKLPEYVESLTEGPREQPTTADLGPTYPPVDNPDQVSEWERQFYEGLYAVGLRPRVQYPVEQYLLDFALLAQGRKLDIEVDGERYHKNWDGELLRRDQIRNQRLIELGWDVMRFWVYHIRDDFDACVGKVQAWADAAKD